MPLHVLSDKLWFPPVEDALADGLLAIGGDLSQARLIQAYKSGIFPWFEDELPLWWSPNPRFVLFPDKIRISKSMKSVIKKGQFQFTFNQEFEQVITNCQQINRSGQKGTWITEIMRNAYIRLHQNNSAISGEAWANGELAGGLYGVVLGKVFFGESMFSWESNASKFAFFKTIEALRSKIGLQLIDCQVYTPHLESLGAEMIDRKYFQQLLQKWV